MFYFSGKKSFRNVGTGDRKDTTEKADQVVETTVIENCPPVEVEPIIPNKNSEKSETEVKNEVKT